MRILKQNIYVWSLILFVQPLKEELATFFGTSSNRVTKIQESGLAPEQFSLTWKFAWSPTY